jgi:hypothetical protein
MKREKFTLKWSKKENDWVCNYPNLNGKHLMNYLFEVIKEYNLKNKLEEFGFNHKSFKISIEKVEKND